ncbi:protein-disulfide reductase DsbD family protein [Cereibacter sp. SYSU M97828]|nr:protein-disulfide reductase DsbD family protein [Cereibacter flavus]
MFRFALLASLLCAPFAARAEMPADIVTAAVLPGWQTPGGTRMAAVHLRLAPEWKTYWRSPGEAGIPPEFDWSGSENLKSVRFHWPRPTVFHTNGMQTIGYKRDLVLPVELTPIDPSRPVILRASVDLGVCRDICVPAAVSLGANLAGKGADDALIDAALRARPATASEAGVGAVTCRIDPIADGLRVTATLDLPPQGTDEVVVLEPADPTIWTSEGETRREGRHLISAVEMVAPSGQPFSINRSALTVTVLGDDRAVEIRGCPGS